jgi:electron transfer flavoprotein alpha subunit
MKNASGFRQVLALAQCLGGAVGASRVAVDQGWIPCSHQVGLSGKSVTPKLYFALGISGSANHLAGMSSSEVVVAVNKDPEASIFKVADLGIVGDLSEVVPALLARLGCSQTPIAAREGGE